MGFLSSLSALKRNILGYNVNDKTLANALDALKDLDVDENFSNALQIIFKKVMMASKDSSKTEAKAVSSYMPEPEKFESTSALQMKYEDLKKSSEQEIQRLNNHIKGLMEKLTSTKDQKRGEKSQKYV